MKSSRKSAAFIYGSVPHSILKRAQTLQNPSATALLLYLVSRTLCFRRGSVDLTYEHLIENLKFCRRTVTNAAKRLENDGDIVRQRLRDGSYRWFVLLNRDEVLSNPNGELSVRDPDPKKSSQSDNPSCKLLHDPPAKVCMTPMQELAWGSSVHEDGSKPDVIRVSGGSGSAEIEPLKKVFKEKYLKKHHGPRGLNQESNVEDEPKPLEVAKSEGVSKVLRTDDEPFHKKILRELQECGVSQRKARSLCREYDHQLLTRVITNVKRRSGVRNIAGYIVTELKDGGYENHESLDLEVVREAKPQGETKTHSKRTDAVICYRSTEETRAEQERVEREKLEREQRHEASFSHLVTRFRGLPEEFQQTLKRMCGQRLQTLVPANSRRREQMLKDETFKRMAFKEVVEQFFAGLDQGLEDRQALGELVAA